MKCKHDGTGLQHFDDVNALFALCKKKRPVKEAVEQRVDIMAAYH
jgi:hypothetical protein